MSGYSVGAVWIDYNSCSCSELGLCFANTIMLANGSSLSRWIVPGFSRGCLILEALLQSDLRCFFDQTCLDDFQAHLEIEESLLLTHLNLSVLHRFRATTTIGAIIDQLMIDNWDWKMNYSRYYDMCKPKQCVYRVLAGRSWVLIISTLVGLVGGLVTVLRLIVPRMVWLARWKFKRNTRNSPGM